MYVVQTDRLSKSFGSFKAVDDISIQATEGEIYGFLGLNGSGKTTTIRMLLGMIRPSSGIITLFGKDLRTSTKLWHDVGYLVETPHAYPDLTVKENLQVQFYYQQLRDKSQVDGIVYKLNLQQYINVKAKNLSLGNLQRLGLAKALIHKPRLLILDEPINGLDPSGIVEIRGLLMDLSRNGTTIFISSHILSEISKLAHRIGIINQGKLIKEIMSEKLLLELKRTLTIHTNDNSSLMSLLSDKGYNNIKLNKDSLVEIFDPSAIASPDNVAAAIVEYGLRLKSLTLDQEDLESYFLRTINHE